MLLLALALLAYVQEVEVGVEVGSSSSSGSGSIELLPMMLSSIVDALYALRCTPACASLHWHCCPAPLFRIFSCDSNFTHEIPEMLSYFRLMIY